MNSDPNRSRAARESAERALVQVVHEYGKRPEFVVLGGLVPELLCSTNGVSVRISTASTAASSILV